MSFQKPEETAEQIEALTESMKRYKELRKRQKESRRGFIHSNIPATYGGADNNAQSVDNGPSNGDATVAENSTAEDKTVSIKVRHIMICWLASHVSGTF